ncbi:MAG: hypothetical protein M1830_003000 [Pleopsidium flavum]|nr:MAG: hypothetical protein M1830_003000 [Pleopsidium flavum]
MSNSPPKRSLTSFKLLSFDIYGTLIDWETGITTALRPLTSRLPSSNPLKTNHLALGQAFNKTETAIQREQPDDDDDEATTFAASIGSWPAFPDTVAAMQTLAKHYKLVPLSNVDRASFSKTLAGPLQGVRFDAVYTAQDIGSYKPSVKNFEYLLQHAGEEFGVGKDEVLHVAQSLTHDVVPSGEVGLASCWIARGEDGVSGMGGDLGELEGKANFMWRFPDLGALAEEVGKEFAGKGSGG